MIASSLPATPALGSIAAGGCAPSTSSTPAAARADETAARDFAAVLAAMLPGPGKPLPIAIKKVDLQDLADATMTSDTAPAADADELTRAEGTILAESLVDPNAAAHAHGVTSMEAAMVERRGVRNARENAGENSAADARVNTTNRNGRPMRPTEAAVERRRAIAAANAAARSIMSDAAATSAAAITGAASNANANGAANASLNGIAASRALAPSTVTAATEALDPAFSSRLDRVIARMADAGHTVEVRETLRTPERQQALFAQGRTTSGPVVTWTLDSRHLSGNAADVLVDGKASGAGYDLLHTIANEEGLRTLGAKDPGHLELPRTTADAREGAAARRGGQFLMNDGPLPAHTATVVRPGGIARVARVASVAHVAQVAQVAAPGLLTTAAPRAREVASDRAMNVATARAARATTLGALTAPGDSTTVASVGAPASVMGPDATASMHAQRDQAEATVPADDMRGNAAAAPRNAAATTEAERDRAAQQLDTGRNVRTGRARRDDATIGESTHEPTARVNSDALRAPSSHATRYTAAPIAATGSLAAERVAELLAARDAQPAAAVHELRLAMDPVADGLSEVRLAVQNGALDATLRTGDAGVARGLAAEVSTLTRSLERQGFESARVAVQLDQAQQARAAALDTVAAMESTAQGRGLRGDSDAASEGRDDARHQTAHDTQRDQQHSRQHARQFGSRRPRSF